ncbi:MAG: Fe-S cluster assembly scaffold protein NifU [Thermoplasmata archaeon]|nr:Fe-S cluster assembly scaffold protein NifU [Thermoplasmata archaeon]NIS11752.1 Fe-S cluster assembly scaffold protein NifU [Thermoplasmata archaeon]NIS21611.1 Fe-S cluster assembly scaffold protein NifU [Thermoplasmata archaeon]NIT76820.1 Fe-S cluster assembly scaffold protein NifU [Thermoplasmata archaeon]NIU48755.1 Fe-S cluster assembly scaffold protein NifU [Thermoplasmata archaeon]
MYSDKVKDHFMNPRNMGELESPDGIGVVGNPVCGDVMKIFIQVEDGRIADVKFQTFGCAAAIATSSMITEMAKNKTIDEALEISRDDVANELDGLPKVKMHCSNLAADGLRAAIEDWEKRMSGEVPANSAEGTQANPCDSCAQMHEGECETRH